MIPALAFIRQHWRPVAVVAAVALAFVVGRASAPKPEVKVETRERVVYQDRIVEKRVEVKVRDEQKQEARIVYRDRVIQPDGTRHEREIEASASDTRAREQATAMTDRVVTRDVVREVEKRVEVHTPAPSWRVGAMAGFSVTQARLWPPDPGPLGFGAIVERRIVGPVSVGAWGLSSGQGGLLVTVEF